jgi:hypothetical protein
MNEPSGQVPPELVNELVMELGDPDRAPEDAADTARAQDPEVLVPALLQATKGADALRRRRLAWVVKQVVASPLGALVDLAADRDEDAQARRFLIEGLARLGHGGVIGWDDVAGLVDGLRSDPAATVREAAVGLAGSFGPRAGQRATLLGFLADSDAHVVVVAAAELRGHEVRADELDHVLLARLREHPRVDVRAYVRDMLGES